MNRNAKFAVSLHTNSNTTMFVYLKNVIQVFFLN